jgi:hypothetical protein
MNRTKQGDSPESDAIVRRLDSIRQALGADRIGVARRLTSVHSRERIYEVLAVSGVGTCPEDPARSISLTVLEEVMRRGTPCAVSASGARPAWLRRLRRWNSVRMEGWPFPSDRLPSVFFVAHFAESRDPGPKRRWVARTGMDALARQLAPPAWAPLARTEIVDEPARQSRVISLREAVENFERKLIRRALSDAGGNKAEAARQLRVSRQGLYRKLKALGMDASVGSPPGLDTEAASA